MGTPAKRYTADDVPHIQAEAGRDIGYELVDGELIPVTPAGPRHGRIAMRLGRLLDTFVEDSELGRVYVEVGFVLEVPGDPERLRGPDLAFVADDTLAAAGGEPERGFFRFAPDLAIEIESPNDRKRDLQQRVRDYLDGGAKRVWTLHPRARSAMIYHPDGFARMLREDDALADEGLLPGLRIPLVDLFD